MRAGGENESRGGGEEECAGCKEPQHLDQGGLARRTSASALVRGLDEASALLFAALDLHPSITCETTIDLMGGNPKSLPTLGPTLTFDGIQ